MENPRELRLALAMRGGASMAVWIGGAVAEINRLRQALDGTGDSDHPWAKLAKLVGYEAVSLDVLAGASAGGLNGALLSASLVYGMPFDEMRRTWVRLADIEALARPVPKLWQPAPRSLLEGDEYFRTRLDQVIADNVRPAGKQPGNRMDLLLTATLLDPITERHFDARFGPMPEQRRAAMFRFHHEGHAGDPLSDFGEPGTTALQLAQAARTTSSFPFAFEPARVFSAPGQPPAGEPNMFGLFSEATEDAAAYRVIDGGVLDNIPVTAAIKAMAAAPADRPTRRYLLYLNPDPKVSHGSTRRPPLALPVASAALRDRFSQESLLSDLDVLAQHNQTVQRNELRRKALFAPLHAAPEPEREALLLRTSAAVRDEHAQVRAELDAQAVFALLTEPSRTKDGTLLPPVIGDPLHGWSAQARVALEQQLSAVFAKSATGSIFEDVHGLLTALHECLGWATDIERFAENYPEIGRCKSRLYRLVKFAEVVEAHADRYWVNSARLEPIVDTAELDAWIHRVLARRQRLQHRLPTPIEPLVGAVLAAVDDGEDFQRALADLAAELESIVESSGADAAPDCAGFDVVASARTVLHQIADQLAAAAPPRTETSPEQLSYALLENTHRRAEVLDSLVVLTAPLDVGRTPGSRIDLLRVVSDEQTPLPFTALRDGDRLRLEDKIRGLDLGDFGSFLSAKWRANDWMWGRMDAAATLVSLLADPERLMVRHPDADALADALAAVVTEPAQAELGVLEADQADQWRGFLTEVWNRHAGEVRAELAELYASPDAENPMPATRALLTERLQWTIAAAEVPYVESVSLGADRGDAQPAIPNPSELTRSVERFDVGRQRVADLGEPRRLSIATRLGLLAYRALQPNGAGVLSRLARGAISLVKPVFLVAVLALAAPRRAALTAAVAIVAGVVFGTGLLAPGILAVSLAGVVLTLLATVAYRPVARVGAVVLSAIACVVSLLVVPSGWLVAGLVTAYAQTLYLSVVDVLRPRPRWPGVSATQQGDATVISR